jgi:nicotinate phosphoribosyltransferase
MYNFSMCWGFQMFPDIRVRYRYICRMKDFVFPTGFDKALVEQCEKCEDLSITPAEEAYLGNKPWYPRTFLKTLHGIRLNHQDVAIQLNNGHLGIQIEGYPYEVCFWECTLLPTITQMVNTDFRTGEMKPLALNWKDRIRRKAEAMAEAKVNWIDFGTRRRYSTSVHEEVVRIMKEYAPYFRGTSNVFLAMKYGINAAGTYAHQWEQLMQAIYGPRMAARMAMQHWGERYHGNLGTALSDTLTTDYFLKVFDSHFANLFTGVRQDSGDPFVFADKIIAHYKSLGIDPMTKIVVFSDSLDVEKAIKLHRYCEGKIRCTMGIGTHLTNDVGYRPMNHVIKMFEVFFNGEWIPVVKLSDDAGKHTGNEDTITHVMKELRIAR